MGEDTERNVQLYLGKVRERRGVVSGKTMVAAARGILMACARSRLVEYSGDIRLSRFGAYSLLGRMNFIQHKATTAKPKFLANDLYKLKECFLQEVRRTVSMEEIPVQLILNWDQTAVKNCSFKHVDNGSARMQACRDCRS